MNYLYEKIRNQPITRGTYKVLMCVKFGLVEFIRCVCEVLILIIALFSPLDLCCVCCLDQPLARLFLDIPENFSCIMIHFA